MLLVPLLPLSPAFLPLPLSVLFLASLSSLLLVVFLVTKLDLLLRNTGELQWPEPQELMREYTFTSLD